jgi:hypothetical protein
MFPPSYRTHPFQLLKSSFPSSRVELNPFTGRGERTTCPARQYTLPVIVYSFSSKSLPDEAGPGVAAGVTKVDDQGKVAVVDSNLGETNDAGDALLL